MPFILVLSYVLVKATCFAGGLLLLLKKVFLFQAAKQKNLYSCLYFKKKLDFLQFFLYSYNMKIMIPFSYSLISALIAQVLCQITKFISYSIKDKKLKPKYLFTAGGMPSSHSAFVTALTVSIGMYSGFNSELFAVSFVFSAVIIYDAYRLRGTVQTHSRIIQKLILLLNEDKREPVEQMVGHTGPEVFTGIIAGVFFAVLLFVLKILFF